MHWIIGRIEIENNLPRRPLVRFQEQPDEQILGRRRIMRNLVITRRFRSAQLEPIQRRFSGYRLTILPPRRELARQYRHDRVFAQLVMVVEILVTERDSEHPLADQRHDLVLDKLLLSHIAKAGGEPTHQVHRAIRCPQEQRASVRSDRAAIEGRHNLASFHRCKSK
jgi:hypothetical protein